MDTRSLDVGGPLCHPIEIVHLRCHRTPVATCIWLGFDLHRLDARNPLGVIYTCIQHGTELPLHALMSS